jgi:transposase
MASLAFLFAKGAGESPLFPPLLLPGEAPAVKLLHTVRRDPRQFGHACTRWTLALLLASCLWLGLTSLSGLWRVLLRYRIHLKRAREHVHSPDPFYEEKLAEVARLRQLVRASNGRLVLLYMDEFSYSRHPTLAKSYEEAGAKIQPLARRSQRSELETRLVAGLNAQTGQVIYRSVSHVTRTVLVRFFQEVRERHPLVERIYIVQDNWPVHVHPDVLVALEAQETKFERPTPKSWPKEPSPGAVKKYSKLELPIQLVPLPTYASWTNPIEKLWRKLKSEVLHLHPFADAIPQLRAAVNQFLDQFAGGSRPLLRYAGLLP